MKYRRVKTTSEIHDYVVVGDSVLPPHIVAEFDRWLSSNKDGVKPACAAGGAYSTCRAFKIYDAKGAECQIQRFRLSKLPSRFVYKDFYFFTLSGPGFQDKVIKFQKHANKATYYFEWNSMDQLSPYAVAVKVTADKSGGFSFNSKTHLPHFGQKDDDVKGTYRHHLFITYEYAEFLRVR